MMHISYHEKKEIEFSTSFEDISSVHTSPQGAWYFYSHQSPINFSKYLGYHVPLRTKDGWDFLKTIHAITVGDVLKPKIPTRVQRSLTSTTQEFVDGTVTSTVLADDVLLVSTAVKSPVQIFADVRMIHDFSTTGRFYSWIVDDSRKTIVLVYDRKVADDKDSQTLVNEKTSSPYKYFVGFRFECPYESHIDWLRADYFLDKKRSADPINGYVIHALTLFSATDIFITAADSLEAVHQKLEHACENRQFLQKSAMQYAQKISATTLGQIGSMTLGFSAEQMNALTVATMYAKKSFMDLCVKPTDTVGLFAGLPWFGQFWTRDEAIAIGALIEMEQYPLAVQML
ncbi:MAG TPA: hypothetical protein VK158_01585, partial [Acidobacteriota bacterium]|nr:hypothetical protein [Acidobacteriota bacterium]